jgi:endonuclease/exonuclease/phosphatase family metal-dependent hydrolase
VWPPRSRRGIVLSMTATLTASAGATMVVVSWNLQGRGPRRLRLTEACDAWQPDVLLLQEADAERIGSALPPSLGARHAWPHAATPPGIVIASRWPLEDVGSVAAGPDPWDRERVCWARLMSRLGPIVVGAVHLAAPLLPGAPSRRVRQRTAVAAWAEDRRSGGDLLIVGGDFNTVHPRLPGLTDASDAAGGSTWRPLATGWLPPVLRLDAIFVSPGLAASGSVDDRWRGSDHCPVVARIGPAPSVARPDAMLRGR